ncbi:hypothetical protein POM88_024141 [Heracleum sosnowskyi]|uniref:Uncharacterized protein n=1 Tax=Heracleum sosnowskyi TaxID=360622 RepID=A0AAD8I3I8_9APIA|nr:hypothetical protein POM88_024141 [Heracleum sosnowskyi]
MRNFSGKHTSLSIKAEPGNLLRVCQMLLEALLPRGIYKAYLGKSGQTRQPIEELDKILEFNSLLITLKKHPDASSFARGLGTVFLLGGEYDGDRKMDDLKLLYRTYVTDSLSSGRMEEDKVTKSISLT